MSKTLVIVESPTKARTIKKFLGGDVEVLSSYGHIRDLPKSDIGVDVAHDFAPRYIIPSEDKRHVDELKRAAKNADEVILASDEDREGEAIAWHVAEALGLGAGSKEQGAKSVKRIVFHEITKSAIAHALANPRAIDMQLVKAQQARRILDRLVGYTLSPLLWRKVGPGLSAGRVQSVAVRVIVDREREIKTFKPEEYWTIAAELRSQLPATSSQLQAGGTFTALLKSRNGEKFVPHTKDESDTVVRDCEHATWTVASVEEKEAKKTPPPPFTTSTLQQEASKKLGFSVKQTMTLAQRLYETGHITYMRTDAVTLSQEALAAATAQVRSQFGASYVLPQPRTYTTKSKGAQEAHEAIRPTDASRTPDALAELEDGQRRLYELIWLRTMATQMPDARLKRVGVDIQADSRQPPAASPMPLQRGISDPPLPHSVGRGGEGGRGTTGHIPPTYTFRATGQTILFDGFLRVYQEGREEGEREQGREQEQEQEGEKLLPPLTQGEQCDCASITPEQHFTKPPPRYTEATLVKKLEEEGIGRPSTYAPTISTIQARGYVEKDGRQLKPGDVAFMVHDLLAGNFPEIVDLKFTAKMEEGLDAIAEGKQNDVAFLRGFWEPFSADVKSKQEALTKADVSQERVLGKDPTTGLEVLVRLGRFGPYVQLGRLEDMPLISPPPTRTVLPFASARGGVRGGGAKRVGGEGGWSTPAGQGDDANTTKKSTRKRIAKPKKQKPKSSSLLKGQDRDTLTLAQALALLSFPRVLGTHEGKDVSAHLGRFGPYVKCGDANATIPPDVDPTTITLDRALQLCADRVAQKKKAAEPLRTLGEDPASRKPILIKDGRYGPYVTDGTTHASIPKKSSVEEMTLEGALDLLENKRKRGPSKRWGRKANDA